jgi:hypothetical protein
MGLDDLSDGSLREEREQFQVFLNIIIRDLQEILNVVMIWVSWAMRKDK